MYRQIGLPTYLARHGLIAIIKRTGDFSRRRGCLSFCCSSFFENLFWFLLHIQSSSRCQESFRGNFVYWKSIILCISLDSDACPDVFCGWYFKERFLIFRGSVLASLLQVWLVFPMALRLRILPYAGFFCFRCTTARVGCTSVTGRITGLPCRSDFYCFNYYGLLAGRYVLWYGFMELLGRRNWN